MKKIINNISLFAVTAVMAASCSEWDDHYDEAKIGSTEQVTVYDGDAASYIKNTSELSKMSALYERAGVYDNMNADGSYTFIVCDDNTFDETSATAMADYANYSVADISLPPSSLVDGFGISTRLGKYLWVDASDGAIRLDAKGVQKTVKTANGYIYYVDGMLSVRKSVYEFLKDLNDEYSDFRALVTKYDTTWFDREQSTIIGVSQDGSTLYDSVKVIHNTLMDRYDENGQPTWNMRDENYKSTMFVPTNTQIRNAVDNACDSIRVWLKREPTAADSAKFREWIVKACFVDRQLSEEAVGAGVNSIFKCVGGYRQIVDVANDKITYESIDAANWLPSVQTIKAGSRQQLSNGNAYYLDNLKIPNHIVIHRVKTLFYDWWDNAPTSQRKRFIWNGWDGDNVTSNIEGQGSFYSNTTTMGTWPDILYNVLATVPTQEAMDEEQICSVEFPGYMKNEDDSYEECYLPAGEYYLRMGFIHSLPYHITIYFRNSDDIDNNEYQVVKKNIAMITTASNYHFDRGGASDIKTYGEDDAIGYPEGYNPADWLEINENAYLYDTDGWNIGKVTLKHSGVFRIKVESYDEAVVWKNKLAANPNATRGKNDKEQLMMYHWCLRPTANNY